MGHAKGQSWHCEAEHKLAYPNREAAQSHADRLEGLERLQHPLSFKGGGRIQVYPCRHPHPGRPVHYHLGHEIPGTVRAAKIRRRREVLEARVKSREEYLYHRDGVLTDADEALQLLRRMRDEQCG